MTKVLMVAGDVSGDMRGAELAKALKRAVPQMRLATLGGEALKREADEFAYDLVGLGAMGFWEPIRQIPKLRALLRETVARLVAEADVVVPVDYYGFNIHVCRLAKKLGKKLFYYVSPQVWASREHRVRALKECEAKMLVLFPFEEAFYRERGVEAHFVGHPLLDRLPQAAGKNPRSGQWTVGLLPGSRRDEIRRLLPVILETAKKLQAARNDLRFVLFASPGTDDRMYEAASSCGFLVEIVREEGYEKRRLCDLAVSCSGTATLENALLGIPMAVLYKTSWPTYALARLVVRVKHIGIVNILAGREIVPEFIQHKAEASAVAAPLIEWLKDLEKLEKTKNELLSFRSRLGSGGAADRAASFIAKALGEHDPTTSCDASHGSTIREVVG